MCVCVREREREREKERGEREREREYTRVHIDRVHGIVTSIGRLRLCANAVVTSRGILAPSMEAMTTRYVTLQRQIKAQILFICMSIASESFVSLSLSLSFSLSVCVCAHAA